MERLKKIIGDAVFVIQILIVFILIFESRIAAPPLVQAIGRMHPLLLHLPIGLLLVTVILLYTRKYFEGRSLDDLLGLLLYSTALTASLTTLMGLILSLEGSFGAGQLQLHKWLGVALSFLCWGLLAAKENFRILKPIGLTGVILLIFTGHYGANLTHGEDFVWAPLIEEEGRVARVITDSTTLFAATVEPIFESKCYGCHNQKKAKGDLILTSLESMLKGGETGPLWKPKDPANSLLVERLELPLDHDDHMPPKDKSQLTDEEINFISLWISDGADTKKKLNELTAGDTLGKLASAIISRYQQAEPQEAQYSFRFASPDKIQQLSKPNRTVFQIAKNEPAIQADFYLRDAYSRQYIEELLDVKEQLVSLNLSKMPVQDADLKIISKFSNLEVLNLNNTNITSNGLGELSSLSRLRSLSLSGTAVTAPALRQLTSIKTLGEVYIWNTAVSPGEAEALAKQFPAMRWDIGFIPDEEEVLKLNPPMLKNKKQILDRDEKVVLKHNLPGTIVRYTLDGTDPDSIISPVFKDGLEVGNFATVKAKAFKDGWLSSSVTELFFFRKGYTPDTAKLVTQPDDRFRGEGVTTLLDAKQGLPDFYRHPAWMAFRENDLVLDFSFERENPTVKNITISFAHNGWHICLPPDEMQLWGGNDPGNLKLIHKLNPPELPRPGKARIEGMSMDVPASNFRHYRLVAKPTRKLANGNPNKRTLWLMVDEVLIN